MDDRTQEEMAKFFEHAKAQSSVEYVPRACAEKILKQVRGRDRYV